MNGEEDRGLLPTVSRLAKDDALRMIRSLNGILKTHFATTNAAELPFITNI